MQRVLRPVLAGLLVLAAGCAGLSTALGAAEIQCAAAPAADLLAQVIGVLGGRGNASAFLDDLVRGRGRDAVACAVDAATRGSAHPVEGTAPASTSVLEPGARERGRRWLAAQRLVVLP